MRTRNPCLKAGFKETCFIMYFRNLISECAVCIIRKGEILEVTLSKFSRVDLWLISSTLLECDIITQVLKCYSVFVDGNFHFPRRFLCFQLVRFFFFCLLAVAV